MVLLSQTPNKVASGVLGHSSPCDVPQGYASVAEFPAALLDDLVGHLLLTGGNAALLDGLFEPLARTEAKEQLPVLVSRATARFRDEPP